MPIEDFFQYKKQGLGIIKCNSKDMLDTTEFFFLFLNNIIILVKPVYNYTQSNLQFSSTSCLTKRKKKSESHGCHCILLLGGKGQHVHVHAIAVCNLGTSIALTNECPNSTNIRPSPIWYWYLLSNFHLLGWDLSLVLDIYTQESREKKQVIFSTLPCAHNSYGHTHYI